MATGKPDVLLILADDREKLWTIMPAAAVVQQHVATFEAFPPRQAPPGFNTQGMVEAVLAAAAQRQGN